MQLSSKTNSVVTLNNSPIVSMEEKVDEFNKVDAII